MCCKDKNGPGIFPTLSRVLMLVREIGPASDGDGDRDEINERRYPHWPLESIP